MTLTATDVIESIFRMYLLKEKSENFEKKFVLSFADYLKVRKLQVMF